MGFEKTSLGLFKNLALVHSITFSIGINHIIKDISKVCSLNLEESENIVNKIDFSFQDNEELFDENDYLKDVYFNNSSFRKISKSLILNILRSDGSSFSLLIDSRKFRISSVVFLIFFLFINSLTLTTFRLAISLYKPNFKNPLGFNKSNNI